MEGVMMCRVTAPLAALIGREAASRPSLRPDLRTAVLRRIRIVRHRAFRWFGEPIAVTERERRDRDLDPSIWRYQFMPAHVVRERRLGFLTEHSRTGMAGMDGPPAFLRSTHRH